MKFACKPGLPALLRSVFLAGALLVNGACMAYSVSNGRILDNNGNRITIKGVNWFGFETETRVAHGLWARPMGAMLDQMEQLGFNAVRVPFCPAVLRGVAPQANSINFSMNPSLQGLNSLQLLDAVANAMEQRQIYFLMDHHRPDCLAISDLWYINGYTEAQWIADLRFVADRYKNFQYFLGVDLKNEPHGTARWGSGNTAVDWNTAAERASSAVLAAAPQALVFVEGISDGSFCTTVNTGLWWGGNIAPQLCRPLNIRADKLVLSPHVYGPDVFAQSYFSASGFPSNMPAIWNSHFGDVQAQGYAVVIGETGGFYGTNDPRDKTWQDALFAYLKARNLRDVFYWSWNPNSGDTGGILNNDWTSVRQDKVSLLQSFWAGADNPTPNPDPNPNPNPNPNPTPVSVSCTITNQWPTGYCANCTVTNNGSSAVSGWTVTVPAPAPGTIYNVWNASATITNGTLTASPVEWNRTIQAGQSVTFGFCANR